MAVLCPPMGIQLEELSTGVGLWFGTADRNVPVGIGQYLANKIPNSRLHMVDDGGHFSTINNHIESVLGFLAGDTDPTPEN